MPIFATRWMVLLLLLGAVVLAPGQPARAETAKQASIVVDANTGKVLHAQSADEPRFPASLTKMMTLYILFGEIEQGRLTYDSRITFTEKATKVAPSKLGLKAGDTLTVLDAIKALVVKSANDVAVAVAEAIGGSEYRFARLMTERARQIGMASTTFRNASGLPNPEQKTTARDMVTLGLRLQDDFPQHYRLFSLASFTLGGKTYKTHNTLMLGFPGMDGIKTGYTRVSGFNLVSSVHADGKHIIGAVFGGKTAATRNALMRSLLYTSLAKASTEKTRSSTPQLVAERRPAKPPATAQAGDDARASDDAWAAKTLKAPPPQKAPKAAKAAPVKVAANAPSPAPAVRPPRHDPIGAMLAAGEGDTAAEPPQAVAGSALPPPRLDLQALRAAMAEPEAAPPPGPTEAPSTGSTGASSSIAGLIRHSIVEDAAPAPVATLSERQTAPSARPPSTLDSQAHALTAFVTPAEAAPASPSHLNGPSQFQAAPVGAGYAIQIGAYNSAREAQSKLDLVRSRAAGLLDGHGGVTLPVQRDNRQFFRARFVQFDEHAASNTCLELRRLAIDCFVMKAD